MKGRQRDPCASTLSKGPSKISKSKTASTKHGPVVATSHAGCANCLRREKAWMIFAFTKGLRANRPAGCFLFASRRPYRRKSTVAVASLVRRDPVMKKQSSVAAAMAAPKVDLAQSYLQLQRLRQLVQQKESSHVRHIVDSDQGGPRINTQHRHKRNARVSL